MKIALAAGSALALLAGAGLGTLRLMDSRSFQLFGTLVQRVDTDRKVVALTFDDGPTPGPTLQVLDLLRQAHARATFFVTGQGLDESAGLAPEILAAGDELGNHSYSHTRMVFRPISFYADEVERTDRLIRRAGQRGEILFRPPFGKKLVGLPWYLSQHHRTTVMWDVQPDSESGEQPDTPAIVSDALSHARPGSIILLHVMYLPVRASSLRAVRPIVEGLQRRGFQIVTVSELLRLRRGSA
jgi:peptidoglycan-N-acetylglucosamine deacetylase